MSLNGMDQNGNCSDDMSLEPSVPLNSYTRGVYGEPKVLPRVGNQYQVEIPASLNGMDQNGNCSDDMSLGPSVPLNSYTRGVYGEPKVSPRVGNQYQVEIPASLNGMDQNGNCSDDMSLGPSVPLNSYTRGMYGEPEVSPRVGNQYQVEIPALISESEYNSYTKNPLDEENKGGPFDFVMGLPISIIWVNQDTKPNKNKKVEFLYDLKHASKKNRRYEHNVESSNVRSRMMNVETDELEEKIDEMRSVLAPGSSGDSWTDIEKASFLLGLYFFRKNFVKVRKFVETKSMGEVLLCYHGKFYQTVEYRRWSGCRKGNTRKCALGERFFSGLRQQELLSRLIRGISDELQHALMQVSKSFSDRKMSLEDYIFSLKNMVGINNLANAVGIGRGKEDLTYNYVRHEVPTGKACNSLSRSEIVEFLTGNFRLSKARSYDLFWEAVWPILVEKGWNATELNKNGASSKQSQVFFVPGVPKSSSLRGLVIGEQYFDSLVDVLNLIASDPGILDLDDKKDDGTEKTEVEGGINDLTAERRGHCYLQPRTPSRCTDEMAFTVVDTSLSNGKTYELRDLRDLPVEVSRNSISQSSEDFPEVSTGESDCAIVEEVNENVKKLTRSRSENGTFVKRKDLEAETSLNHGIGSKNAKSCNAHIAPDGKRRRRLTSCSKEASSQGEVNLTRPSSGTPEITENIRASSMESFEERVQVNEPNDRPLLDLNLPAELLDFDCDGFLRNLAEPQDAPNEQAEPMAAGQEEQVNLNSRRQSSRNRPPTARALEAIAHGFLSVNTRSSRVNGLGTSDAANGTNSNIPRNGEI